MDVETLRKLVSSAIWRAEQLDDLGTATAPLAWLEVATIEEALAETIAATDAEGRIARRGAVNAALKAGDYDRAVNLIERYGKERDSPQTFRKDLRRLIKTWSGGVYNQFPHAAKRYDQKARQTLVDRIHKGGPFGLAAFA